MKTVKLKVFKGAEMLFTENGTPKNENHFMKVNEGKEWMDFLKYIPYQGFCRIDIISASENSKPADTSEFETSLKESCKELKIKVNLPEKDKKSDKDKNKELKLRCDELGIKYKGLISNADLEKLISDFEESKKDPE